VEEGMIIKAIKLKSGTVLESPKTEVLIRYLIVGEHEEDKKKEGGKLEFQLTIARQPLKVLNKELISELMEHMGRPLIGRAEACQLVMLGLLSCENVFLYGPPGVGKSVVGRQGHKIVRQRYSRSAQADPTCSSDYFEVLLSTFSGPEDVFGPVNVNKLMEGKFERDTSGRLPQAHVAFIDEIFKANKGILNALLTILNERTFDTMPCPLLSSLGASNEILTGSDMAALYDRFLIRGYVDKVQDVDISGSAVTEPCGEAIPAGFWGILQLRPAGGTSEEPTKFLYTQELQHVKALVKA